jgi:hypothetical protein
MLFGDISGADQHWDCRFDVSTGEVYKWTVLALSISSDFWLRWLVHEA